MIRYLVAKYIDDLTRNEPTNVGVIVYDGSQAVARFDGEDDHARIDLRRLRGPVTGKHAYRAWVDYWRAVLENPANADAKLKDVPSGDSRVIEHLISSSGRDFYMQPGGTILIDAERSTPQETLDDLFMRLVRQPDPPAPPTLREKSRQALAQAGAPLNDESRFVEQQRVSVTVRGATMTDEISYAVKNGTWHYLQEMPFSPDKPRASRKEASHCAFLFEHLPAIQESGAILYDESDITDGQYQLLEMLMQIATTVDVNKTDYAADRLQKHLHLG